MAISQREWAIQFESTKKRIQYQRTSGHGAFSADEETQVKNAVNILEAQLRTMSQSPLQYEISPSEIARRQVLLVYLQKQVLMVTGIVKPPGQSRMQAFDITSKPPESDTTFNPVNTSDRGLVQRQQDMVKLQDHMIVNIESGVNRLHNQAQQMGEEAKLHDRLLDDLDSDVDMTTNALQAEAAHAERIKETANVCKMYICIAVEIVVLFVLIMIIVMAPSN